MSDKDSNAPSWLTADPAVDVVKTEIPVTEKPAKAGMFKMFSKEAATEKVQKAATQAAVTQIQTSAANVTSTPDDGFTPAWAVQKAYTPPDNIAAVNSDIENNRNAGSEPTPLEIEPETLKRIKFYHIIVRVLYMISGISRFLYRL